MRKIVKLITVAVGLMSCLNAFPQDYNGPALVPEFVCDLGKITPEHVIVKGST